MENEYEAKVQQELAKLKQRLPDKVMHKIDFEMIRSIGKGGFGEVRLARHKETGTLCAFKEIFSKRLEGRQFRHFIDEAFTMSKCDNPFVLELFGFTTEPPYAIITPYIESGSLGDLIKNTENKLSPTEKMIIAMGIADGMEHIHSKKIFHRDLKTANVLIDSKKYPKICDFGIARYVSGEQLIHLTAKIGTPISMAPELLLSRNYTEKVDVYAFSIVLYELVHGKKPYKGMKLTEFQQRILINGERAKIDPSTPAPLTQMIEACWSQDPNERPTFHEIYEAFLNGTVYFEGANMDEIKSFDEFVKEEKRRREMEQAIKAKGKIRKDHHEQMYYSPPKDFVEKKPAPPLMETFIPMKKPIHQIGLMEAPTVKKAAPMLPSPQFPKENQNHILYQAPLEPPSLEEVAKSYRPTLVEDILPQQNSPVSILFGTERPSMKMSSPLALIKKKKKEKKLIEPPPVPIEKSLNLLSNLEDLGSKGEKENEFLAKEFVIASDISNYTDEMFVTVTRERAKNIVNENIDDYLYLIISKLNTKPTVNIVDSIIGSLYIVMKNHPELVENVTKSPVLISLSENEMSDFDILLDLLSISFTKCPALIPQNSSKIIEKALKNAPEKTLILISYAVKANSLKHQYYLELVQHSDALKNEQYYDYYLYILGALVKSEYIAKEEVLQTFIDAMQSYDINIAKIAYAGFIELFGNAKVDIDKLNFIPQHLTKNDFAVSVALRFPLCCANEEGIKNLSTIAILNEKVWLILIEIASDEKAAQILLKNTEWMKSSNTNAIMCYRVFLMTFSHGELRDKYLDVDYYFTFLTNCACSKNPFILSSIPSIIKRQHISRKGKEIIDKINESKFLKTYFTIAINENTDERNNNCLVLIDIFSRIGYFEGFQKIVRRVTELIQNPKLFSSSLSILLLLSNYKECAAEMRRYGLVKYFSELEKFQQYQKLSHAVLKNIKID